MTSEADDGGLSWYLMDAVCSCGWDGLHEPEKKKTVRLVGDRNTAI
jgi:hypothetical protein